jgi:hypothetical protein
MKKILTNYIFNFLFEKSLKIKKGDILICQDDIFIFNDKNGNPNSLKKYYSLNGFWNYIKAEKNSIYNTTLDKFLTTKDENSQGYLDNEYYKNSIDVATTEQKELYLKKCNER